MCLVVFAWRAHPDFRLILAANRDEFHERPADPLHWWPDKSGILAGRDLAAGGTWLGVTRGGRVATVTNYREDLKAHPARRSRGVLVSEFLAGPDAPLLHARAIDPEDFAGFSLLTATGEEMVYVSNRGDAARRLSPGVYALSNASLDTPWTKVLRSKARLTSLLETGAVDVEDLFKLLGDRESANGGDDVGRGLPADLARAVSAPFVTTPDYGTRCSTVLLIPDAGKVRMHERRFAANGMAAGESAFEFELS